MKISQVPEGHKLHTAKILMLQCTKKVTRVTFTRYLVFTLLKSFGPVVYQRYLISCILDNLSILPLAISTVT